MKYLVFFSLGVFTYLIVQLIFTGYFFLKAKNIMNKSYIREIERGDAKKPKLRIFLAGDSIAEGIGSSGFEKSLGGRLVAKLSHNNHVLFVNSADSGNKMSDLKELPKVKQDIIVLFVSSNDLFHFTNFEKFEKDTRSVLSNFTPMGKKVILIGPADVASATAIPFFLKPLYNIRSPEYARIMMTVSSKYKNVVYINPVNYKEMLEKYGKTEAEDRFHPNDNGHKFWADLIGMNIQQ